YLHLTIGYGTKLFTFTCLNIQLIICRFFFIGGYVKNGRYLPYLTIAMLRIIVFERLLHVLFAVFFYMLYNLFPNVYIFLLLLFNLWLALINLIPFKVKDKQSDGYMILNLLRKSA